MTSKTTIEKRVECPNCGKKGRRVSRVTLHALLKEEFARDFASGDGSCCAADGDGGAGCRPIQGDTGWRFCDSLDCDVVYFSETGDQTFVKSQLKIPVGVKETSGERPLCYCFGHSVASIKEELRTKGRSDALEDIRAKMKAPGCHCETSNPSGSCCLGSVRKGIKLAQEELGMTKTDVGTPASPSNSSNSKGEKIAKVGTIVSAIMASACCWLPLLLLALGVSGAGIASTLEAYRPYFIVITFGFLAAAFYFTYRPTKSTAAAGHGCCPPEQADGDSCCVPTGKQRFSMMTLNKIMLWVVTALAIAFLFFPSYVGALLGTGDANAVTNDMNRTVIKVEGMTCEGCATTVAQALRSVPSVKGVTVSYEQRLAIVGTDPSQTVPEKAILEALLKAGYRGRIFDSSSRDNASHETIVGPTDADEIAARLRELSGKVLNELPVAEAESSYSSD